MENKHGVEIDARAMLCFIHLSVYRSAPYGSVSVKLKCRQINRLVLLNGFATNKPESEHCRL